MNRKHQSDQFIHYQLSSSRLFSIGCFLLFSFQFASAQDTLPENFNRARLHTLVIGSTAAYAVTLVGLNELWYKESPRTGFHFFNDHAEWQQVDKAGHLYTAYQISRAGTEAFRWAGVPHRKSVWLGSLTGILFQMPIEILDGFSAAYGASWGDVVANTAGSALNLQQLLWDEPRIHPKFSFHQTRFAPLRPKVLGENLPQQLIKDYNGQTYWLAFDVQPWLGKESRFPKWLNVAIGYGAENMVYARKARNQASGLDAYRQYYLSLDVNPSRIPTRSKFLRSVFFLLNTIHVPAPAIEFNRKQGVVFHGFYF